MRKTVFELLIFGIKLGRSCKFAAVFFSFLLLSHFYTFGFYRYDFLFICLALTQVLFIVTKIESIAELKVIILFHVLGIIIELFKTNPAIGAWAYPEPALLKISTVPLYSGFMYSAVASFVIQSWRILQIKLTNYPSPFVTIFLAVLIYVHFFLKHFGLDLKWLLVVAVFLVYRKTQVFFSTTMRRKLPLAFGFLLVGTCIWIAENISTYLGAWRYPNQQSGWSLVHDSKIVAWFLLYIVSFIAVTQLRLFREQALGRKPRATGKYPSLKNW